MRGVDGTMRGALFGCSADDDPPQSTIVLKAKAHAQLEGTRRYRSGEANRTI